MLRLIDPTKTPPGGFRYLQKDTGYTVTGAHRDDLLFNVRLHRTANARPFEEQWQERVEDWLCRDLIKEHGEEGKRWCEVVPEGPAQLPISWGLNDVARFTLTLADNLLHGGGKVSSEIATARAEVCSTCADNVPVDGCVGCSAGAAENIVQKVAGGGSTRFDAALKACRFCGCFNKAAIWFPIDQLRRHMSDGLLAQLPGHCWKNLQGEGASTESHKLSPAGATPAPVPI